MGMDRETGKVLQGVPHVQQSCVDVLQTVRGERVMRLSYGSRLLESIADAANPRGRALLLGRISDPLQQWEGDRMELRHVGLNMSSDGHMLVSVEGSTDEGKLRMVDQDLTPDPRISAFSIRYRKYPIANEVSLGDALDWVISEYHLLVSALPWVASNRYVAPSYDPLNAAGVLYRGRPLQYVLDELLVNNAGLAISYKDPIVFPAPFPGESPVYEPVPNADAIAYDNPLPYEWTLNSVAAALWQIEANVYSGTPYQEPLWGVTF